MIESEVGRVTGHSESTAASFASEETMQNGVTLEGLECVSGVTEEDSGVEVVVVAGEKEGGGEVEEEPLCHLSKLPENRLFVEILSYLRSMDFVQLTEVNKSLFGPERISRALQTMLVETYGMEESKLPTATGLLIRPDFAYVCEIRLLTNALKSPIPNGPGYYVSASWLANARKYFEALPLPEVDKKKTPQKKSNNRARIRQRRGSEALPPWPDVNADITCEHGNLALSKGIRAKRRLMENKSWHLLRKFYPQSQAFKSRLCGDCPECANSESEARIAEEQRREHELRERQEGMTDQLWALANRSKGVPGHCLVHYDEDFAAALVAAEEEGHVVELFRTPPVVPGLYHLVPRSWLRVWRSFVKGDQDVKRIPALDCTCLLCSAHGMLVPPPHVDSFLKGLRGKKYLLGGLGDYGGQQYEIVTTDEWDALSNLVSEHEHGRPDFTVRFSCDGESITWSTDMCSNCDPFEAYGQFQRRSRK